MTKPKVAFYSAAWRGGSGWFVHELALAMARAGARVTLVSPEAEPVSREPRHPDLDHLILPQGAGGQGSLPYRAYRSAKRVLSTFPAILRGRLRARTYVVTHTDWLVVAVTQSLWMRLLGARLIFVIHDVKPHAWGFPERFRGVERWLLELTYRLPTHLVTLTSAARDELLATYRLPADRASVIPHGAFIGPEPEPLPGDRIVLVFGMLRRNKRIQETIRAMALLPATSRLRLVIAGAPHAEDRAYWEDCAAELPALGDRVRTEIGFVEEARVSELVGEADALILPYEEFSSQSGVAILATFAERLLIATDVGGIGELIGEGLEIVPVARPVTPATIAAALEAFEALPVEEMRAMAKRSRDRIANYLDWDRIGGEYVKLIETEANRR